MLPFAETGGDGNHFGFLMDGDAGADDRPIVRVEPASDSDATQIVAPSLRACPDRAVPRDDLVALVRLVEGKAVTDLENEILGAPGLEEIEGDFF